MKTPVRPFIAIALAGACLLCGSAAQAGPAQPHMRSASAILEAAKTAKDPLPSLRAAQKQIARAKHNKAGERVEAMKHVQDALAQARVGDREKMLKCIDRAIASLRAGIDRAD